MASFRNTLKNVFTDLTPVVPAKKLRESDKFILTIIFFYCIVAKKGFRAVATYRFKHYAHLAKKGNLLQFLKLIDGMVNRIDISHRAEIGSNLYLPHPLCIVIGDAVIGHSVKIYQGVTIGATWGKEKGSIRYPTIGDNVKISAGVKIIGPVSVGNNSIIGANAVVVDDIPENSIAVGIPAKVIKQI